MGCSGLQTGLFLWRVSDLRETFDRLQDRPYTLQGNSAMKGPSPASGIYRSCSCIEY